MRRTLTRYWSHAEIERLVTKVQMRRMVLYWQLGKVSSEQHAKLVMKLVGSDNTRHQTICPVIFIMREIIRVLHFSLSKSKFLAHSFASNSGLYAHAA